jgi:hypothetical protein
MTDIDVVRENTSAAASPLSGVRPLSLSEPAFLPRSDRGSPALSETSFSGAVEGRAGDSARSALVLDPVLRVFEGIDTQPLARGEVSMVLYLGSRVGVWHSSYKLAANVYQREDVCARQLVWKYMSTLRKKLGHNAVGLLSVCRRRGYCWHMPVVPRSPSPIPSV